MKNITQLFILILIYSCSSSSRVISYANAPEWVQNHPVSQNYYIGIGVSKKQRGIDYRKQAKSNAYEEISSEISVSISSNSILKQQDNNGKFKEMFNAISEMHTENELKGCKKIASWENKDEYWVYYKLSKSEVEKHKQIAIEDALISLDQAVFYDQKNEYVNAISSYSMAISSIKPYLGQRIRAQHNGRTIFLGQFIIDKYKNLISSVNLEHNQSELKFVNFQLIPEIEISLTRNGKKIKNVPLKIVSDVFKYKGKYRFNSKGKVTLPRVRAKTLKLNARTTLSINIDEIIDETVSGDLVKELLKNYKTHSLELEYMLDTHAIKKTTKDILEYQKIYTNSDINSNFKKAKVTLAKATQKMDRNKSNFYISTNSHDGLRKTNKSIETFKKRCLRANATDAHLLIKSVKDASFDNTKLIKAKKTLVAKNKCFTTKTIKKVTLLLSFEATRLSFLKYAYSFTSDKNNYHTLSSLLTLSGSKKELATFIRN